MIVDARPADQQTHLHCLPRKYLKAVLNQYLTLTCTQSTQHSHVPDPLNTQAHLMFSHSVPYNIFCQHVQTGTLQPIHTTYILYICNCACSQGDFWSLGVTLDKHSKRFRSFSWLTWYHQQTPANRKTSQKDTSQTCKSPNHTPHVAICPTLHLLVPIRMCTHTYHLTSCLYLSV